MLFMNNTRQQIPRVFRSSVSGTEGKIKIYFLLYDKVKSKKRIKASKTEIKNGFYNSEEEKNIYIYHIHNIYYLYVKYVIYITYIAA